MTKLDEHFLKISEKLNDLQELLDEADFGGEVESNLLEGIELPKKKKEREAFLIRTAREKFPKLMKDIDELNIALEGFELHLDTARDKIQDKIDALDEIEDLQQELEERKNALDL